MAGLSCLQSGGYSAIPSNLGKKYLHTTPSSRPNNAGLGISIRQLPPLRPPRLSAS